MEEGFDYEDIDSSEEGEYLSDESRHDEDHSDYSNEVYYDQLGWPDLDGNFPVDSSEDEPTVKPIAEGDAAPERSEGRTGRGGARSGAGRKAAQPKPKRGPRSEYFTFTCQLNYDEESSLQQLAIFRRNLREMIEENLVGFYSIGHEIAPQTGRHHLQGYMETVSNEVRWTFQQFKDLLTKDMDKTDDDTDRIWVKEARGSATENLVYTGKAIEEGRWYQRSEHDVQFRNYGRGNKLGKIKTQLESKIPMLQIAKEHFDDWCKHRNAFKEFKELVSTPRMWPTQITWIHGATGKGKSQFVLKTFPPPECYWLDPPKNGNVWWDYYDGHETVVVDEVKPNTFGLGHAGFAYILRLLDSTPLRVGVHGGKVNFAPKRIIFTANFPPSEWFKEEFCGYPWDATNPLYRRFRDFGDVILWKSPEDYWLPQPKPTTIHIDAPHVREQKAAAKKTFSTRHIDPCVHVYVNPSPQDLPLEPFNPFRDPPPKDKDELF